MLNLTKNQKAAVLGFLEILQKNISREKV